MEISQTYIDFLRAAHLLFFAAGMGTALYLDFLSFWSIQTQNSDADIRDIERIHLWVAVAFAGLWITGLSLIYVRTGFDFSAFSPKLWAKIAVMVAMTVNSLVIAAFVLPMMRKTLGNRVIDLSLPKLIGATQIAAISVFCWTSGLVLGSSVVFKTAPWDVLLPLLAGWFVIVSVVGQIGVLAKRRRYCAALVASSA